jgi:hypothetical protein
LNLCLTLWIGITCCIPLHFCHQGVTSWCSAHTMVLISKDSSTANGCGLNMAKWLYVL